MLPPSRERAVLFVRCGDGPTPAPSRRTRPSGRRSSVREMRVARGAGSVQRAAWIRVLDDLRLWIAGLLDDDVAVVSFDDLLRLGYLMAIEDGEPPGVVADRFLFNDTETTEIYTLSLHEALPNPNSSS